MTGEEIISNLLYMKRSVKEDTIEDRTIDEVIKALEQEPCEDAVSREAVRQGMLKYGFHAPDMTVTEFVEDELPPVTPARSKGKWNVQSWETLPLIYVCSECGFGVLDGRNYCPNCGAKMEGEGK